MIINWIQALYDPKTPLPVMEDVGAYEQALADIRYFEIGSQMYYLLNRRGLLQQMPDWFQEELKSQYTEALYHTMLINNQTKQLLEAFESAELQVIPLKGVLFAETYFGHIGARWTSDIDLFIQPADLTKAIQCVKASGFTTEEEFVPSHFHWSFSKSIPGSPVPLTVELHWDLLKAGTSSLNVEELWHQALPLEPYQYVLQLSEYHTFYMICLHGWRHNLSSLKYFIDIIQLIWHMKDRLDYDRLLADAAVHKTLRRVSRTLRIVYREFPQLEQIQRLPLKRKKLLWWDYNTIRNGDAPSLKYYVNFMYFHLMDFDSVKHSWGELAEWLLPSKAAIGYELGSHMKGNSMARDYWRLYMKRGCSFIQFLTGAGASKINEIR